MASLILKKDGSLIRVKDFDQSDTGKDVSDVSFHYLNDLVTFDDGVTLRSLFTLISQNIDMYDVIFGNWIPDYTNVILNGIPTEDDGEDKVDYLNIYRRIDISKDYIDLPHWPDFGGVGFASKDSNHYKKGDKITFGLELSPMQNYADLPLKLESKAIVWNNESKELTECETNLFTLYEVVQSIIWEISFHGSPDDAKKISDSLTQLLERIKNGEEKLIPIEEVFENFKPDIDQKHFVTETLIQNFTMEDVLADYTSPE